MLETARRAEVDSNAVFKLFPNKRALVFAYYLEKLQEARELLLNTEAYHQYPLEERLKAIRLETVNVLESVDLEVVSSSSEVVRDPAGHQVYISLLRSTLDRLIAGELSLEVAIDSGLVTFGGDTSVLIKFFSMLDEGDPEFPIVTPRSDAKVAWIGRAPQGPDATAATRLEEAVLKRRFRFVGRLPRGC